MSSLIFPRSTSTSNTRSNREQTTSTSHPLVDPPGTTTTTTTFPRKNNLSKPAPTGNSNSNNNSNSNATMLDSSPDDAAIRSLQSRLWNALQQEDAVTALWCCQATRADWQVALEQQLQQQQEQSRTRRSLLRSLLLPRSASVRRRRNKKETPLWSLSLSRSMEDSIVPAGSVGEEDEPSHPSSSSSSSSSSPLLFQYTSPSEPFPKDDSPYDESLNHTITARRRRRATTVRHHHAWTGFWTRHRAPVDLDDDSDNGDEQQRWTTLLHEAARLGNVPFLKYLLQHPAADCNVRNGAGRTALHCVAAGVPSRQGSAAPDECGERLQAAELILQWSRPTHRNSHDASVSQGVSTNVVDRVLGRTALHYAAELGRTALCEAIVGQYFGTLLTVLDAHGQTPCDVAAQHGFNHLAARLEARALLDPYGTDEELWLASVRNSNTSTSECDPPWAWFETLASEPAVQHKRQHRLQQTWTKMQSLLDTTLREREWTQRAVAEHAAAQSKANDTTTNHDELGMDSSGVESGTGLAAAAAAGVASWEATKNNDGREHSTTREDSILLDLSSFMGLHMGHVEQFLSFHQFDVKRALQVFSQDPLIAFQEAGIPLPLSHAKKEDAATRDAAAAVSPVLCLICCEEFESDSPEWLTLSMCDHGFCRDCLAAYLAACAATQSTGLVVPCPHHACSALLTPEELAAFDNRALLATAREQFVVQAHDLKFCPHPGCTGVVQFRAPRFVVSGEKDPTQSEILQLAGAVCTAPPPSSRTINETDVGNDALDALLTTYEGVKDPRYFDLLSTEQPRSAHRFCFRCGDPHIHWPITCDDLSEWNQTVTKHVGMVMEDGRDVEGRENADDVAQKLWIKANTRPCPKCQAPIQKNEGCNHMICSNPHCKHEFCWICRNSWKLHSSATGGFFRCNRWVEESEHESYDEESSPVGATTAPLVGSLEDLTDPRGMSSFYGTAEHETRAARKKSKEMSRFLHHYQRWHAHADSAALERQMAESVCTRLAPVVREVLDLSGSEYVFDGNGLSFIHAAFTELLECRSMLQHSYAFSFLRYKSTSGHWYERMRRNYTEKRTFEQTQSDLELMVEQISDVVARSHIRATQTQIAFLTHLTAGKRKEFSNVMISALVEEKKEEKAMLKKKEKKERRDKERVVTELAGGLFGSIVGLGAGGDESASPSDSDTDENVRESLASYLAAVSASHGLLDYASDNEEAISDWPCAVCTYVNTGGSRCEMCDSRRAP